MAVVVLAEVAGAARGERDLPVVVNVRVRRLSEAFVHLAQDAPEQVHRCLAVLVAALRDTARERPLQLVDHLTGRHLKVCVEAGVLR